MPHTVYLLTDTLTCKRYVGMTVNLKKRMQRNRYYAQDLSKQTPLMQAFRASGFENFTLEVLAVVDDALRAAELEREYIRGLGTMFPDGLNANFGRETGDAVKAKLSAASIGKSKPAGMGEKLSAARKAMRFLPDSAAKNAGKLTREQVVELRLLADADWSFADLGRRYGISQKAATRTARRIYYADVE